MLRFLNTLSGQIETFVPHNRKVRMYVCGPTVYDDSHLGHARTYILFDSLRRYLRYRGYEVTYIINLTDIDDKIIKRAKELGESTKAVSDRYASEFFKDMSALKVEPADKYPRVSMYIQEIIDVVDILIEKGFAYPVDCDVLFEVSRFERYGRLSNQSLDQIRSWSRFESDPRKRDKADFFLWKADPDNGWDSPWGKGRPGWHIECTVMSTNILGEEFEIHGGGTDLIFPHHENEIAQSEVLTGKTFARYWIHTAFLRIGGNRMGKSEQNFIFVRDALKDYSAETIRHFLVSAHYRSPLDYNGTSLSDSDSAIRRLNNCLSRIRSYSEFAGSGIDIGNSEIDHATSAMLTDFGLAMDEDFNTALAMGEIYKMVGLVNRFLAQEKLIHADQVALGVAYQSLIEVCMVLGIYTELESTTNGDTRLVNQLMELVIDIRNDSRLRKDWVMADKVRDQLHEIGIELQDTPSGTNWKWEDN